MEGNFHKNSDPGVKPVTTIRSERVYPATRIPQFLPFTREGGRLARPEGF